MLRNRPIDNLPAIFFYTNLRKTFSTGSILNHLWKSIEKDIFSLLPS